MNFKSIIINRNTRICLALVLLIAIPFIIYYPSLHNEFTNWDDIYYVTKNDLIKKISTDNLSRYFTVPVSSNFHPLTIFSLSLDYHFFGVDPSYYHLHNLILHLLNIILTFYFIYLISSKNIFIAFLTTLIFGIHPMHVESVAWISERKDVLYSFYFLLGMLLYLFYLNNRNRITYTFIIIIFILSTFSKSAAVIFPLCLLLIDYYKTGKIVKRQLMEKVPFFLISLVIGIIALKTQSKTMFDTTAIPLGERIALASYGYMEYLVKFFFPVNLNALYLLPKQVPVYYYLLLPCVFGILTYSLWLLIKRRSLYVAFGIIFYTINIVLVLQFVTIGWAVIAERYTYIPYIGVAFILSTYIFRNFIDVKSIKISTYLVVSILFMFLLTNSVIAYNRTKVWESSESLWKDAIEKDPDNHVAYYNLGDYYHSQKMLYDALRNYSKAIDKQPRLFLALKNRALILYDFRRYEESLSDINRMLEIENNNSIALKYKQLCLSKLGKVDDSLRKIKQ
jgi:protein O-mannosyl-transferase